jgi:hypothetical protein
MLENETKVGNIEIDIVKEKTVNSKREEIKSDITNKGRVKILIFFNLTLMECTRSKFYIQV